MRRALALDHPVIHLPREQAQRQTDHAGAIARHPLNGVMRLASIGGAENGLQRGTHRRCVAGRFAEVKRATPGPTAKRPEIMQFHVNLIASCHFQKLFLFRDLNLAVHFLLT